MWLAEHSLIVLRARDRKRALSFALPDFCESPTKKTTHYNDVIMGTIASQITSLTIVYSTVYSDAVQRNTKAMRHWPLSGEFPTQMASNAENVSIWWRHHDCGKCVHDMTQPCAHRRYTITREEQKQGVMSVYYAWPVVLTLSSNSTDKPIIQGAPIHKTEMLLVWSWSCLCPTHWSQVLSRKWRWSWSSAVWRHISGETLAQVIAGCLMTPSHCQNQCWLIIRGVQLKAISQEMLMNLIRKVCSEMTSNAVNTL